MKGLFELKAPDDLFKKLQHDYEDFEKAPLDQYAAFNFFLTAEHIPDWLYPGKSNKKKRENTRKGKVLLQICSHLATGAKHFQPEAKQHQSVVSSARRGGTFGANTFASGTFATRTFPKNNLIVELKGDAEKLLGPRIRALELAMMILDFWSNQFSTPPSP
jgi:hypothetical protein